MRILAVVFALVAGVAQAEGSLMGRVVSFGIETYDDPAVPLYAGERHEAVVGKGIEFGLLREGEQNGIDVVPVQIDITDRGLVLNYSETSPSDFLVAGFNGYVLRFIAECVLFEGAALSGVTTPDMRGVQVSVTEQELRINVSGLSTAKTSRIGIELNVTDCPIS